LQGLEAEGSWVVSDHVSNYWNITGQLPDDKKAMLAEIDRAMTFPENQFRTADLHNL
jgi:negative regulator of replication initiation